MLKNNLGAVIVTYNPRENLKELLEKLKSINEVIVIDNNSQNRKYLQILKIKYPNLIIVFNEENQGLAKSYNQAEKLFTEKIEWFFTFDQDSLPKENMIYEIQNFLEEMKNLKEVSVIVPKILDKNLISNEDEKKNQENKYDFIEMAIQSGMCIRRDSFKQIKGFEEKLFMYYVDTDFINRLKENKYKIIRLNSARLYHEDGKLQKKKLIFEFYLNERSSTADYYRSRNLIYMIKKYGHGYTKDIIYDFFVKTIFSKKRKNYYKNTFKGLRDGIKLFF